MKSECTSFFTLSLILCFWWIFAMQFCFPKFQAVLCFLWNMRCGFHLETFQWVIQFVVLFLCCAGLSVPVCDREHGRAAVLSHHARSEWGRMPFTSLLFSANSMDHGGYFVIQHLKLEKIFQGSLDRVAFFFPSSSCCLDTNTKLFFLQRNKLDVPGWLFFILSREWISQCWISSDTSLLSCVGLKTLTSAAGLIYSTKGGKSVYSCLNSVLK